MKTKKIPMRMCIGCHTSKPKKELVRVVRATDGTVSLDTTGRLNGRGAYICPSKECVEAVCKSKRLGKIFDTEVNDEVYQKIADDFDSYVVKNGGGNIG